MSSKVLPQLIGGLVDVVITMLPKDVIKKAVNALLDKIEEAVMVSENPVDDKVVLTLCALIRQCFDIPDND